MEEENKIIMAWGDEHGNGRTTLADLHNYMKEPYPKEKIAQFVYWRLYERYIRPFEELKRHNDIDTEQYKNTEYGSDNKLRLGFSIMANMCLLIETLQAFKEGLKDSNKISENLFKRFFQENEEIFGVFNASDFYRNIRCGILHQGETNKGWRIQHVDNESIPINWTKKIIYANKFLEKVREVLETYTNQLKEDNVLLDNACKKIQAIIKNCKE